MFFIKYSWVYMTFRIFIFFVGLDSSNRMQLPVSDTFTVNWLRSEALPAEVKANLWTNILSYKFSFN